MAAISNAKECEPTLEDMMLIENNISIQRARGLIALELAVRLARDAKHFVLMNTLEEELQQSTPHEVITEEMLLAALTSEAQRRAR